MLSTFLKTASEVIEYVGSVTKSFERLGWEGWVTVGEAPDVLSVAQTGDLVVIAFTFDNVPSATWSWAGMSFSEILNQTGSTNPGAYVGYHVVQSGDTNPYIVPVGSNSWDYLTVVVSVFRGVNNLVDTASNSAASGLPDPPSLTANGGLWVITGHMDDADVTDWVAPANYTIAASSAFNGGFFNGSSTVIAYRIDLLSSDDPAIFTGTGSDDNRATTSAFV